MITYGPLGDVMVQMARAVCDLVIGIFMLVPV